MTGASASFVTVSLATTALQPAATQKLSVARFNELKAFPGLTQMAVIGSPTAVRSMTIRAAARGEALKSDQDITASRLAQSVAEIVPETKFADLGADSLETMTGAEEQLCWSVPRNGKFKNLVLDLGGVIMKWDGGESQNLGGPVDAKLASHMLQDSIWNEYETGKLTSAQAFDKLSMKFEVPAKDIESTVTFARDTLTPIPEIVKLIEESRGLLRLFCMTNITAPEFEHLESKFPKLWENFEKIYTSADVGMRKPDLVFFRHVIRDAGIDPRETIFVDDTLCNCVAARSLGVKSILCENIDSAMQELYCTLRSEEERLSITRRYIDAVLTNRRQDLETVTREGIRLSDNACEFLIADILQDERFLPMASAPENGEINYSRGVHMTKWVLYPLPNDLDTTSIGVSSLYVLGKVDLQFIQFVVDKMLDYISVDGIFQTYYDHSRPRIDHVVVANITFLFHLAGRTPPPGSLQFLYNVLLNEAYLDGSQYYIHPAMFLFLLSRTAAKFRDNHFFPNSFIPLLTTRIRERMGVESDHFAVASIILACLNLQMEPDVRDIEMLARAQKFDGSWDLAYVCQGNSKVFGNKVLATAFALTALRRVYEFKSNSNS